jgi:hypothetical protein
VRDGIDDQLDAFQDEVWDKVQDEYGRWAESVGNEDVIEWIAIKDRPAVLALVLDGLHGHGLTDRITLIRSEPDPHDWQRDRDFTVLPHEEG